jgi:hypothetical protein
MADKLNELEEKASKKKSNSPGRRTTWGRIPIPAPQDIVKILPWVIAVGAGVAAALGWIDNPTELLK